LHDGVHVASAFAQPRAPSRPAQTRRGTAYRFFDKVKMEAILGTYGHDNRAAESPYVLAVNDTTDLNSLPIGH
jgi:hypothetical protein